MITISAKPSYIEYSKLLSKLQEPSKQRRSFLLSMIKLLGNYLLSSSALKISSPIVKKIITDAAEKYGVYFAELKIRDRTIIRASTGGRFMMNISVSISDINWSTLAGALEGPARKTGGGEDTLQKALKIIQPDIENIMAAVPSSTLAELLELLGREKLMGLAEKVGIKISSVSVDP